jgi:hypothetical protein
MDEETTRQAQEELEALREELERTRSMYKALLTFYYGILGRAYARIHGDDETNK